MSEEREHIHISYCPECMAQIEEFKTRLAYITKLEEVIRRELGESAVPERPAELQKLDEYLSNVERAREEMQRDQAEINRLADETRARITRLLAA